MSRLSVRNTWTTLVHIQCPALPCPALPLENILLAESYQGGILWWSRPVARIHTLGPHFTIMRMSFDPCMLNLLLPGFHLFLYLFLVLCLVNHPEKWYMKGNVLDLEHLKVSVFTWYGSWAGCRVLSGDGVPSQSQSTRIRASTFLPDLL